MNFGVIEFAKRLSRFLVLKSFLRPYHIEAGDGGTVSRLANE